MPVVLGSQGAGIVEQVGEGVDGFHAGDRVAYVSPGGYAERRLVPAGRLLHLPPDISEELAASLLLRGLTAEYLLRRLFKVHACHTVLVHAASGGMGLLLGQWAKSLGARTIGTVGSDAKVSAARANGYDEVIVTATQPFAPAVLALTGGVGADVIYDGVGKAAFLPSLDCIRPMGMVISYGTAVWQCRRVRPAAPAPEIHHRHPADAADLGGGPGGLRGRRRRRVRAVRDNVLHGEPARRYPLRDARLAHEDLQGRKTIGASILVP